MCLDRDSICWQSVVYLGKIEIGVGKCFIENSNASYPSLGWAALMLGLRAWEFSRF